MTTLHLIPPPQIVEIKAGVFKGACFYKANSRDILLSTIEEELANCYSTDKIDDCTYNCINKAGNSKRNRSAEVIEEGFDTGFVARISNCVYEKINEGVSDGISDIVNDNATASPSDTDNETEIRLDLVCDPECKPQEYKLQINENGISIIAKDNEGLFYGFITLKQLIKQYGTKLPCLIIEDCPTVLHRGVQVSYAQVNVEYREEWIKRFIRQMADIKINFLYLYFEWNFAFPSLPPANSKNQLTPQNAKEIILFARKYNITVVPQLNLMGHTQDFLAAQIFDELKEYNPEIHAPVSAAGTTLCVSNPKTLQMVENIIDDITSIFDSEIIHVGGDEVELVGECPLCSEEKKGTGRMGVYLRYFLYIRDLLKAKGRKMGIWGDQLMNFCPTNRYWCKKTIEKEYQEYNTLQMESLKDGTVVFDWWYDGGSENSIEFFSNSGFEVVSATSTNGCMTSALNLGQHANQHALFIDTIKYHAYGGIITDWINYLGYHAEQMSFNYASGASILWTGCDDSYIKGISRQYFEKSYAFVRYGDKTDALINYIHLAGDSNGDILSLFPPDQKSWSLRKRLFYSNNPLDFYLWQARNLDGEKDDEYLSKAVLLNELWEKVEKSVPDDGYRIFLKMPALLHSHLSKRFKACKEFYEKYNHAAALQYTDSDLFKSKLIESARCLDPILNEFDELIDFTEQLSLKLGLERASTLRLRDTRINFGRLIEFVVSLQDNHRPLPSVLNVSEMLFNKPLNEYWVGRNVDWYNEADDYASYDLDNKATCYRVEYE